MRFASDPPPAILICEDEALVAMDFAERIENVGGRIFGSVMHHTEALALLECASPDAAILGVQLADGDCGEVAELLAERGIPFAVVTGVSHADVPPQFSAGRLFEKPFDIDDLMSFLSSVTSARV